MIFLKSLGRLGPPGGGVSLQRPVLKNLRPFTFKAPVTVLCGDNGSGKTTLMEILAGKMEFFANRPELRERREEAQRSKKREDVSSLYLFSGCLSLA